MKRVITYGTFDLMHYGHIKLLERAKALGDYLIVGVTADDFDRLRGKINVKQSLMERIEAVRTTGLADEIIIEEYEGQKIDDIRRYNIDVFTVGSDWQGVFDYLGEYCEVVYLERTMGVSSSDIRSEKRRVSLGLVGESSVLEKVAKECAYVNGIDICGIHSHNDKLNIARKFDTYDELLNESNAVYVLSNPTQHYMHIKKALLAGKHVLCESPIALDSAGVEELRALAEKNNCVLMDSIKTAFSTAYSRLLLLAKSGKIGNIVAIDATATSLRNIDINDMDHTWNSICAWGPTVLLPVFQLLGTEYKSKQIISKLVDEEGMFDSFTKMNFVYDSAVASVKVGKGVKSEGELVITGTKGYIYVPAPWWKTDYFEIRFENQADNKRYYYQLDGEGIRYELVAFIKAIETGRQSDYISKKVSDEICHTIEDYYNKKDFIKLS